MRLTNKAFDILKYVQRHLPDLATFYVLIATALDLPFGDEVSKVICAIAALMAALLEISSVTYQKDLNAVRDDEPNEDIVDHEKKDE